MRLLKLILASIFIFIIWLMTPYNNPLDKSPQSYVLYDANNNLLGARISADQQWRFPEIDSVPYKFEKAIIQFEDNNFYNHVGVDFKSILRAFYLNIKNASVVSGGSTITMQLMRLHKLNKRRGVIDKFKETLMAFKAEVHYSKKTLLKKYCSHAPFGGNVVGLEAASWKYLEKEPNGMSWAEACMLAVLPNAPSIIHLGKNRSILREKRDNLLLKLLENNIIDSLEYQLSILESITAEPKPLPNYSPHFFEFLKSNNESSNAFFSTIELQYQQKAITVADQFMESMVQKEINNCGLIIVDNKSRSVVAYKGNSNPNFKDYYNDMIQSPRSSGSVLKPLLYALAIEDGQISPQELASDIPVSINGFSPKNYSQKYFGAIPYDQVISKSLNIPSVLLLQKYGISRFLLEMQKFGFSTLNQSEEYYGLPLILGGGEVTAWDLAKVYSELARTLNDFNLNSSQYNHNYKQDLIYLKKEYEDDPDWRFDAEKLSAGSIWAMLEAMKKVERPNGEGQWERFSSSKTIHWKTGTSYGNKDAWAVGLTPEYTVIAWVGNSDGEAKPEIIGVKSAGTLLFDIFNFLPTYKSFEKPFDDMHQDFICKDSGMKSGKFCNNTIHSWLPNSSFETQRCTYHKPVLLNSKNGKRVFLDCVNKGSLTDTSFFVLRPTEAYFYKFSHPQYEDIPEFDHGCQSFSDTQIEFIYPSTDLVTYIPINLKGDKEKCVFTASHKQQNGVIFWHVDDEFVAQTKGIHSFAVNLNKGPHLVTIQDELGSKQSKWVHVTSN